MAAATAAVVTYIKREEEAAYLAPPRFEGAGYAASSSVFM